MACEQSLFRHQFVNGQSVRIGFRFPFGGDRRRQDAGVVAALLHRLPLRVALDAVFQRGARGVLVGGDERRDRTRILPQVGFPKRHFHVGRLHVKHPPLGDAVAGNVYEAHRFETAARKLFERGRIGGDLRRAEFELLDFDMPQIGVVGDIDPDDAVFGVDLRGADLSRHAEAPLDGLHGADRPVVVLIERQRGVDRREQVERAGQLLRTAHLIQKFRLVQLNAVYDGVVGHGVDLHVADVGGFVEREGDDPRGDVVLRDREALSLDVGDAQFDDGVGNIVADARRCEERRGRCECCFQVSGHNFTSFSCPTGVSSCRS